MIIAFLVSANKVYMVFAFDDVTAVLLCVIFFILNLSAIPIGLSSLQDFLFEILG